MLCESIEETGEFAVVGTAGDGMSALQLVREQEPQLLISEVLLPELDGFGLLDRIAQLETRPRTILLSAMYRGDVVARAMEKDVSFFMPKPCEIGSLLERMRRIAGAAEEEAEDELHALQRQVACPPTSRATSTSARRSSSPCRTWTSSTP